MLSSPLLRRVARLLLLVCVVAAVSGPASIEPAARGERSSDPSAGGGGAAADPVAVRLRKLHLVRPDLIPYPIAYEVCC